MQVDPVRAPERVAGSLNPEAKGPVPDPELDRSDRKVWSVECQASQLKALSKNPLVLNQFPSNL